MNAVLGAVLAGGAGSRLGRPKAFAPLGGRPLAAWPLAALQGAGLESVIVTRRDTPAPDLGVPVVYDAGEVRHPLAGILAALDHAAGRPVLAVAADLPFVDAALLGRLAVVDAPVVVARTPRGLHPLCARYAPGTALALRSALAVQASLHEAIGRLSPCIVDADEDMLFNVNRPQDLRRAEARLAPSPLARASRRAPPL